MILLFAGCPKAPPAAAVTEPVPTTQPAAEPVGGERLARVWVSPARADHPLVGLVWSVRAGGPSSWDALLADAAAARVVYLGESHDNADHHALQGEVIAAARPAAVVFEHLDHEDPVADASSAEALRAASGWDESGWPPFDLYRPVFDAVYDVGAAVVPGHPTRAEVKLAMTDGFDALPAAAIEGLPLSSGLPDPLREDLGRQITASHCGMADDVLVSKMIRAQLLKDTWMARSLVDAAGDDRRVALVAGNGHTRGDRGVPFWVEVPGELVVAFVEVGAAEHPVGVDPEGADYLVFTPAVDEEDPCAAFRAK